MPFTYPRPQLAGANGTWRREDAYMILTDQNIVMFKRQPNAMTPYDHVSIVVDGANGFRPKNHEIHLTMTATKEYGAPPMQISGQSFPVDRLIFVWDFIVSYVGDGSVTLDPAGNRNAGRPVKHLPPGQLVSQAIMPMVTPSAGALKESRNFTAMSKKPAEQALKFWKTLLAVNRLLKLRMSSLHAEDSVQLQYEVSSPTATVAGTTDEDGVAWIRGEQLGIDDGNFAACRIRFPGYPGGTSPLRFDTTYMLGSGRYTCTASVTFPADINV